MSFASNRARKQFAESYVDACLDLYLTPEARRRESQYTRLHRAGIELGWIIDQGRKIRDGRERTRRARGKDA